MAVGARNVFIVVLSMKVSVRIACIVAHHAASGHNERKKGRLMREKNSMS